MTEDLHFVAHPPERRRRSTTLLAAGCCCCCCCCVHSLGSIAGALYGMRTGHRPPPSPGLSAEESRRELAERKAADKYAAKTYWLALLIIAIITTLVTIGENGREGAGALGIAALIVAICLPAGQLGASVLALIYINVFPPARKPDCLKRLGRITLFSFIWGLIGAAVTWIILLGMK